MQPRRATRRTARLWLRKMWMARWRRFKRRTYRPPRPARQMERLVSNLAPTQKRPEPRPLRTGRTKPVVRREKNGLQNHHLGPADASVADRPHRTAGMKKLDRNVGKGTTTQGERDRVQALLALVSRATRAEIIARSKSLRTGTFSMQAVRLARTAQAERDGGRALRWRRRLLWWEL